MAFIDLKKAFDNQKWKTLLSFLKRAGIKNQERRVIRNLYGT